jgi:hypothetical protein
VIHQDRREREKEETKSGEIRGESGSMGRWEDERMERESNRIQIE